MSTENQVSPRNLLAHTIWAWEMDLIGIDDADSWKQWNALAPHERAAYYRYADGPLLAGWTPPVPQPSSDARTLMAEAIHEGAAARNHGDCVSCTFAYEHVDLILGADNLAQIAVALGRTRR